LLPVDEMLQLPDFRAVGEDVRSAMRRRSEPDDVGAVLDGAIVLITGPMVKGDVDRHKG
jgi:hypothetical protein